MDALEKKTLIKSLQGKGLDAKLYLKQIIEAQKKVKDYLSDFKLS